METKMTEIKEDEIKEDEIKEIKDPTINGNLGTDEVDFDLFWNKDRTLLEYCREKSLYPDLLIKILHYRKSSGKQCESIDHVDRNGYGALHHIVINDNHRDKQTLLELLVINGNADVNLTTTHQGGFSALHLAVERSDLECIETLISLDADVNQVDRWGKTPLTVDVENGLSYIPEMRGFQLTSLKDKTTTMGETRAVKEIKLDDRSKKIKELLESVGAHRGSPRSPKGSPRSPVSDISESDISLYQSARFRKINTVNCREVHDRIWTELRNERILRPKDAVELVSSMKMQERYRRKCGSRILCLDGGGIRGLIQMTVLSEIERLTKKKIIDLFDWIVGTSTGGIIALSLIYGPQGVGCKSVRQMRDVYWATKDDIFEDRILGFLAKGNTQKLQERLQEWLGSDVTLDDKTYPKVLIPAVSKRDANLDLHFFNNCFDDKYSKELVWKVARYTSAAPFYFTEFEDYIDGGILANNPSEAALTTIQDYYHNKGERIPVSLLVSVGSGLNPGSPLGEIDIKTNLLNPKAYLGLMEVLESAVLNRETDSCCQSRCREQGIEYFRFNPNLEKKVDSDQHDSKILHEMIITTRQYLKDKREDMERLVQLLKESELTST